MPHTGDIALMAHLMRRAGFGAGRDELEARVAKGYDATVEELLHPETQPPVDHYTLLRHQPSVLLPGGVPPMGNINYMYYLVTTQRPLEEKMALFWHHVFATGNSKVDNYDQPTHPADPIARALLSCRRSVRPPGCSTSRLYWGPAWSRTLAKPTSGNHFLIWLTARTISDNRTPSASSFAN